MKNLLAKALLVSLFLFLGAYFVASKASIHADKQVKVGARQQYRDEIIKELPGLENLLETNKLEAIRRIRSWAAKKATWGEYPPEIELYTLDAFQIDEQVWKPGFGTSCGGFAYFLEKVLLSFKITAFTLDFGVPNSNLTHVTLVVALNEGEGFKFYVFDPTFNASYIDTNSKKIIDIFEVISRSQKNEDNFTLAQDYFVRNVSHADDQGEYLESLSGTESDCDYVDFHWLCKGFPYNINVLKVMWKENIKQNKISLDDDIFLSLFKNTVFSVGHSLKGKARIEFIKQLKEHGIFYKGN